MKTAKATHLNEATLLRHAGGEDESRGEREAARRHVATCAACRKDLATFRKIHEGLRVLGAAEKRHARSPASAARVAGYRETLRALFEEAREAEKEAENIFEATRTGLDQFGAAIRVLDGKPYRGLALLFSARVSGPLIAIDPRRALAIADAICAEAMATKRSALGAAIQARALLLRSQALVAMGESAEGRAAASAARAHYAEGAATGLESALCDYFEGEAACFERDYAAADILFRRAQRVFAELGARGLVARSYAARGTMLSSRGDYEAALPFYERAISELDPERDARALTMTLNNRANDLAQLGRFFEARWTYAKALAFARKNGFNRHLVYIRTGLAEIDFLRGRNLRALRAFQRVAEDSKSEGSRTDVLFASLYAAECLGRMERLDEMAAEVEALAKVGRRTPFGTSPALDDLFSCLSLGTLDADLVCHVREYLQDAERGVKRPYRTLRRA